MADAEGSELSSGGIFQEIFTSPLNLTLLSLCLFLLYKIFRGDKPQELGEAETPLPKLKKRDFTIAELKPYDGLQNPRILMAVNGKVFDVTRGKKFYGPGNVSPFNVNTWYDPFGLPALRTGFEGNVAARVVFLLLLIFYGHI